MERIYLLLFFVAILLTGCDSLHASKQIKPLEVVELVHSSNFIYVDKQFSEKKEVLSNFGRYFCAQKDICSVMYWDNRDIIPDKLPITNRQLQAKVAQYHYDTVTGQEKLILCKFENCE